MGLFDRDEKEEKPDFSNVESGSSSTAPEAREAETEERTHVVEEGDTLWAIADRYYGDGTEWPRIHEANRDVIDDPDVIQPGWELTIPEKEDEEEGEDR
ncbi:MAG: LysM peptidoglycan-binding domain-containing protein [Gemmatimonadota bacterium]|nr:LysM peptidoglycan-binding domain-containing protein [Gemmatimonadota bacterium]